MWTHHTCMCLALSGIPSLVSLSLVAWSHPQYQKAMEQKANMYIHHMDDLSLKMVCQLVCRMEQVVLLSYNTDIAFKSCNPRCFFFNKQALLNFLHNHCIILPFRQTPNGEGVLSLLREFLCSFRDTLKDVKENISGKGSYRASWW